MTNQDGILTAHRGMAALDLAKAYLADMGGHDATASERARNAILDAGLLVYELSGPGHWEAFDARQYFRRIEHISYRERVEAAFTMIGFYGWMAFGELINMLDARQIILAIMEVAPPEPVLDGLCAQTLELMPAPN